MTYFYKIAKTSRPGTYDPNWHLPKRNKEEDNSPQIPGARIVTASDLGYLTAVSLKQTK